MATSKAAISKSSVGLMAYHAGLAAEDQVARLYERQGQTICARRWRGRGGEIDLIMRNGDEVVFIEVKRARTHACAAERVSPRQIARISATALEFVAGEPRGLDTAMRFDVALVDAGGRIEILENALAA